MPVLRFIAQLAGIYGLFIGWGILQEKITTTDYVLAGGKERWTYPCALNLCMAFSAALTGVLILSFQKNVQPVAFSKFWKAAITSSAASPIGYASLQYINYPMMVLTKTIKPVPVLLVGVIGYRNIYPWYQYVTVACLSGGLALYTFASDKGDKSSSSSAAAASTMVTLSLGIPGVLTFSLEVIKVLWGVVLVCVNLTLDGYTNNEQDMIFRDDKISGVQMMTNTNIWQVFFIALYLVGGWLFSGSSSELAKALAFASGSQEILRDIALFCLAASFGQILIFQIMEEHGSLVWITVSITRKLFTILASVIAFQHPLNLYQSIGIFIVFAGISLELVMKNKKKKQKGD
jgi:solute carrier family 35 (UDP-galactose transporter), member B1